MASSSGRIVAAAIAGVVEAAGAGKGLAAVDGAGAGRDRPVKEAAGAGQGLAAERGRHLRLVKGDQGEGEIPEDHGGEGPKPKIKEHDGEITEDNGGEVPSQSSKVKESKLPGENGGEGHSSKADEGEGEIPGEDVGEGPSQKSKSDECEGEIPLEDVGEGPSQKSKADKGKGPATPIPERGHSPMTPRGPILWLGAGNPNRVKPLERALTLNEEDDKLISVLRDSGRVSKEELLKYDAVPNEILANRSLSTREAIHSLFRFFQESALIRRKMLHIRYKGLSQGYLEGSKRLSKLRDDISTTQDEIKKCCGKVLRKTPGYLMADPVLLPK